MEDLRKAYQDYLDSNYVLVPHKVIDTGSETVMKPVRKYLDPMPFEEFKIRFQKDVKNESNILLTPEDLHGLDYDFSIGKITSKQYEKAINKLIKKRRGS